MAFEPTVFLSFSAAVGPLVGHDHWPASAATGSTTRSGNRTSPGRSMQPAVSQGGFVYLRAVGQPLW